MTTSQDMTRQTADSPEPLVSQTWRGQLIPGRRDGFLELDTSEERFELLGPFDAFVHEGDEVEIEGVIAPEIGPAQPVPALLVRHVRPL